MYLSLWRNNYTSKIMFCRSCGKIFKVREKTFKCPLCGWHDLCSECIQTCDLCHGTMCGNCEAICEIRGRDCECRKGLIRMCSECNTFEECSECDEVLCACAKPCK